MLRPIIISTHLPLGTCLRRSRLQTVQRRQSRQGTLLMADLSFSRLVFHMIQLTPQLKTPRIPRLHHHSQCSSHFLPETTVVKKSFTVLTRSLLSRFRRQLAVRAKNATFALKSQKIQKLQRNYHVVIALTRAASINGLKSTINAQFADMNFHKRHKLYRASRVSQIQQVFTAFSI